MANDPARGRSGKLNAGDGVARWHKLRDAGFFTTRFRWCRSCLAQPPANRCEPSGFGRGEPDRSPEGTLQRKTRASETSPWGAGSKLISPFFPFRSGAWSSRRKRKEKREVRGRLLTQGDSRYAALPLGYCWATPPGLWKGKEVKVGWPFSQGRVGDDPTLG